jgi:RHS repeat-associated protein
VNTLQHFGLWDATNGDQGQVLAMVYRYDQLNRLRTARGLVGLGNTNTWAGVTDAATNRYRSEYTYDANGNILSANRWDYEGDHYDEFAYKYQRQSVTARLLRNRLYQLFDEADPTNLHANTSPDGSEDIGFLPETTPFDEQAAELNGLHNYHYDALGNLIHDEREQIDVIEWTVAGKVKSVSRTLGSTRDALSFGYGASGQRVLKQVGTNPDGGNGYREHYIRDAQGNIMATYRYTNTEAASLKLNERPLYGSSRLGSLRKEVELHTLSAFDPASANPVQMVDLNYELTDHLGNVCAVVTGRLLDGNGGGTAKQAELVSAQGYEPFGSLLPGRNYSSDSYAHGFNGMRKDDEIHNATGTSYDFGARLYDPRVGRFLSLDPLASSFADWSPYVFAFDNPIVYIDPDGRSGKDYRARLNSMSVKYNSDFQSAWAKSILKDGSSQEHGFVIMKRTITTDDGRGYQRRTTSEVSGRFGSGTSGVYDDYDPEDRTTQKKVGMKSGVVTITTAEDVIADVHTHPYSKAEGGHLGVTFSGTDIGLVARVGEQDYTMFVEAGSKRWALVIEDAAMMKKHFDGKGIEDIEAAWNKVFDGADGTLAERALKATQSVVGQAATSGLGLYETTDKAKAEFKKVN